jgi:hypothetical protein
VHLPGGRTRLSYRLEPGPAQPAPDENAGWAARAGARARWAKERAGGRHWLVRLRAESACRGNAIAVVALGGLVMPQRPDEGVELIRRELTLAAGEEVSLPVEVPTGVRKPYWLRCLPLDSATSVVDPPTSTMRIT